MMTIIAKRVHISGAILPRNAPRRPAIFCSWAFRPALLESLPSQLARLRIEPVIVTTKAKILKSRNSAISNGFRKFCPFTRSSITGEISVLQSKEQRTYPVSITKIGKLINPCRQSVITKEILPPGQTIITAATKSSSKRIKKHGTGIPQT